MELKLWIDDIRDAPDDSWVVARKVQEAIRLISHQRFTTISLDHDIENRPSDETFLPVAYFIGEKFNNDTFWADELEVIIHSINPVGAKEMQMVLEDCGLFAELKPYVYRL